MLQNQNFQKQERVLANSVTVARRQPGKQAKTIRDIESSNYLGTKTKRYT